MQASHSQPGMAWELCATLTVWQSNTVSVGVVFDAMCECVEAACRAFQHGQGWSGLLPDVSE